MRLIVITKEDGPETRSAKELADQLIEEGFNVEIVDWGSESAETLSQIHDIYSTPAFLVVTDDGKQVELWQGERQPLVSEIKHLM